MKSINMCLMNGRLLKWRRYGLSSLALTVILWGCTVTPTEKLHVKDMPKPFEEGTIISARMGEPVSLQDLLKDLADSRITYVGEKHTNTEHHRIQLQIIEAVFKKIRTWSWAWKCLTILTRMCWIYGRKGN